MIENYTIELKRGTLTLAVLSQLKKPQYGYSLLEILINHNIPIEAGTLYPLLRRLEKQGLLESLWDTEETRPRKYYTLTSYGHEVLSALTQEWLTQSENLKEMIL